MRWLNDTTAAKTIINELNPDWIVWSYGDERAKKVEEWKKFISSIKSKNAISIQGAIQIDVSKNSPQFDDIACFSYEKSNGRLKPVFMPWLEPYGKAFVDVNSKTFLENTLQKAMQSVKTQQFSNADEISFHFDFAAFIPGNGGACFGKHSTASFAQHLNKADLADQEIIEIEKEITQSYDPDFIFEKDIESFDYGSFLQQHTKYRTLKFYQNKAPSTKNWNTFSDWKTDSKLHKLYINFQKDSIVIFYTEFKIELKRRLKKIGINSEITIAGNIHSSLGKFGRQNLRWLYSILDLIQTEIYGFDLLAAKELVLLSIEENMFLSVNYVPDITLTAKGQWLMDKQAIALNNALISLITSHGASVIFPWDIYMGADKDGELLPRYYGEVKDWPIYEYLHFNAQRLNGFRFACSTLTDSNLCADYRAALPNNNTVTTVWQSISQDCSIANIVNTQPSNTNGINKTHNLKLPKYSIKALTRVHSNGTYTHETLSGSPEINISNSDVWTIVEYCGQGKKTI